MTCPKNRDGHLVPRRARRTGNVFWGCSNYPRCDYTTNFEPLGGLHDADDGPLARKGAAAICLNCGSTSDAAPDDIVPGTSYPGGPAEPGGAGSTGQAAPRWGIGGRGKPPGRARGGPRAGSRGGSRRSAPVEPAPDA